jgi:2-(1,2-epoxy-1,2-dihydrophenyl)acetyl-CoA isomerase
VTSGVVQTLGEPLDLELRHGVLTITLNRPLAGNALSSDLVAALDSALERTGDARCVLLRGAGRHFCVGGDVSEFRRDLVGDPGLRAKEMVLRAEKMVRRLGELEVPVVAAVQGAVAGAGLALALVADVVVAASSSRFVPAYASLSLTPDVGVSHLLPRAVGERRALQFLLSGHDLTAETARDWGLVGEVVAEEALLARSNELAAHLAASPQAAETKRLLRSASTSARDASALDEAETFARALATDAAQRHIASFLDRR